MIDTRSLAAEALGTGFLVCAVVGSGIMAERLAGGNVALALLANAIATGAALYVLISLFAPISGAQFNPVVSLWLSVHKTQSWSITAAFTLAQVCGGIIGCLTANAMFGLDVLQISDSARGGTGQWIGEVVATLGLLLVIAGIGKHSRERIPTAVALYITSAYWFTSSTSFANPAVTIARVFSDSFAGIAPSSVPGFVAAQLAGLALAYVCATPLFHQHPR